MLVIAFHMYIGAVNLIGSRSGRTMAEIRDNASAARAMGIDVVLLNNLRIRLERILRPRRGRDRNPAYRTDSYSFFLSVYFVVGLVVGGVGWLPGALVGGVFIVLVPHVAEKLSPALAGGTYGLLLIILMLVLLKGLHGLLHSVRELVKSRSMVASAREMVFGTEA